MRAELQKLQANVVRLEDYNRDADSRLAIIADKNKQLEARKYDFCYYSISISCGGPVATTSCV